MDSPSNPTFTDGIIFLRPLTPEDAAAHLAGEDEEMAKWVSGGRSTMATVQAFIARSQESWRNGGSRRPFGIFDSATGKLIGFIEVNQSPALETHQVNVSYGIFREWRGRGLVVKAIDLVEKYLRAATNTRQVVLKVSAANTASLRVAEKAGFIFIGIFHEAEGDFVRYVRDID